jgi:hypothetical protein
MKRAIFLSLFSCLLLLAVHANAQNFRAEQKKQERAVKAAYKHHKVTLNEYNKLMDEQAIIKETIDKGESLGWPPHEKDRVADKLDRARHRLYRYEHNSERY